MSYMEFCEEFKRRVLGSKRWHINEEDYHLFAKGDREPREFVWETNQTYFRREADTLLGDFALITVRIDGEIAGHCRFLLNTLYTQFQSNGWGSIMALVDQNYRAVRASRFNDVAKMLNDYDKCREHLILRPLNYVGHKDSLKDAVYRLHGDIALVLYYVLSDDGTDLNTFKMRREIVGCWNKDADEVFVEALHNTQIKALPRLYLEEVANPPYQQGAFMAMNSDIECIKPYEIPIVTTTRYLNGAIAMFYPGVLKRISQLYENKSFYVVFISINEAYLHGEGSIPLDVLQQKLRDSNRLLGRNKMLSDKIFFYDCLRGTFEAP